LAVALIRATHELHARRRGRNLGLGLLLLGFVGLMFGMTVVKMSNGGSMEAFDHAPRPGLVPATEATR
jgi:hypothetical protein